MLSNLIVPTLVRVDLLQRLMDSLDYPIAHLLIIDNGVSDRGNSPVLNIPDVVDEVTYLPVPANLGVAGSWNLGVKSFPFADRWFICSDDVAFAPGSLQVWDENSRTDALTISTEWPNFQFFTVGEDVVERIGLFEEGYFPANFEDDDYLWRCNEAGILVQPIEAAHSHVKQGTVHHGKLAGENARTYPLNEQLFERKKLGDPGGWSLRTRRVNDWAL